MAGIYSDCSTRKIIIVGQITVQKLIVSLCIFLRLDYKVHLV